MVQPRFFISLTLCCLFHTSLSFVIGTKASCLQAPSSRLRSKQDQNPEDGNILDDILQIAVLASKNAGEIIRANSGGADVVEKKSTSRDLLTLVDPQCEKVRIGRLCKHVCVICPFELMYRIRFGILRYTTNYVPRIP